ncbi:MAG: flagellar hook-length control protein FliK [Burkholderiales bacterium]
MSQSNLLARIDALIRAASPSFVTATEDAPQTSWSPGQRLQALVLESLQEGRSTLRIGAQTFNVKLPAGIEPGATLELTYVRGQPRTTFALAHDASRLSNLKPEVQLGELSRALASVSARSAQEATPQRAVAPLLAAAPADGATLSRVLESALTGSGLFYESHQKQWVEGQRPLTDLLREPQAKIPPHQARAESTPAAPALRAEQTVIERVPAPLSTNPVQAELAGPGRDIGHPIRSEALPLVQRQLDVLDSRSVVWHGQMWPGMDVEWRTEERDARESAQPQTPEWHSGLRLKLPTLGDVDATLSLGPNGLRVVLNAPDSHTADIFKANQESLVSAMQHAGLNLLAVTVHTRG